MIVLLMLPTVIDVGYRYIFGPSLSGFIEYSEVGLVVAVFLGMGVAMSDRVHIYTPVLTSRLSPVVADRVRLFGLVTVWLLVAVLVFGTTRVALESFSVREFRFGLVEVAIWPAKAAVALGLAALLLEVSIQLLEALVVLIRPLRSEE